MNDRRRPQRRTISAIEALDHRIVPATVSLAAGSHGAALAEMGHLHAQEHHPLAALHAHHGKVAHSHHAATVAGGSGAAQPANAGAGRAAFATMRYSWARMSIVSSNPNTAGTTTPASNPSTSTASPTMNAATPRTSATTPATAATTTTTTTTTPVPNADQALNDIYTASANGGNPSSAPEAKYVLIQGSNVGVDVHWNGSGDFNATLQALENLGMQVTTTSPNLGIIEGMLPIAQLPSASQVPDVGSLTAIYRPSTR